MRKSAPTLLALVCVVARAAEPERRGQRLTSGEVVDHDFAFRLRLPRSGWQVMGQPEARRLSPDAVACAVGRGAAFMGCAGVVMVERAPGVGLEGFARLILEGMTLEGKAPLRLERTTCCGREAVRFEAGGDPRGLDVRFSTTVFLSGGHAYQLVVWGPSKRTADGIAFASFREGFSLLEGAVRGRDSTPQARDAEGPGWRVKDGVFASAAYGFEVRPRGRWHLLAGDELARVNPDAEAALTLDPPGAWVCFIAERIAGIDREDLAASLEKDFSASLGLTTGSGTLTAPFAGGAVTLRNLRSAAPPPIEYFYGVHFAGSLCVQVVAWCVAAHEAAVAAALPDALAALRLLPSGEVDALDAELGEAGNAQNAVGLTFALRGGVYRNFAYGVEWRRPSEGIWRIMAGGEAQKTAGDAVLVVEEPRCGLFCVMVCEEHRGLDPAAYHAKVLEGMLAEQHRAHGLAPEPVVLNGSRWLSTETDQLLSGRLYRYRVLTARTGPFAVQFTVSGYKGNMESAAAAVGRAVRGLVLPGESLRAIVRDGARYEDARMGFALSLPDEGWRVEDRTPPALLPRGTTIAASSGEATVIVAALSSGSEGADETRFMGYVAALIAETAPSLAAREPHESTAFLGGRTCRLLSWEFPSPESGGPDGARGGGGLDLFVLERDGTFYAFIERDGGRGLEETFSLVD